MDKRKEDILCNGFRQRLDDYKLPVSEGMWAKIEQDLSPIRLEQKAFTRPLWPRIASIAALFVLLFGLGWYFIISQPHKQDTEETADSKSTVVEPPVVRDLATVADSHQSRVYAHKEESADRIADRRLYADTPIISQKNQTSENDNVQVSEEVVVSQIDFTYETQDLQDSPEEETAKESSKETLRDPVQEISPNLISETYLWRSSKRQKANSKLSFALAYNNQVGSSSASGISPQWYNETFANAGAQLLADSKLPENPIASDMEYKMPIAVGFTVRKHLNSSWALESGLTYTYLESTEKQTQPNGDSKSKETQLHYIGVPVKAVYSIYQDNRFSVYASAGAMVEKSVYGREVYSTDEPNKKLSVSELQFSLSGSVGADYRLVDKLAVFVEPGVGYYFDDKSGIETIRKDKPWNFNLLMGLRLTY